MSMMLAGVQVGYTDVATLVGLLRAAGFTQDADRLESALGREISLLALDRPQRDAILRALDDPPTAALAELRGACLRPMAFE